MQNQPANQPAKQTQVLSCYIPPIVPTHKHWREFAVRRGWDTVTPIHTIIAGRGYIAGSYASFMAAPALTPILPNDIDIFATSVASAADIAQALGKRLKCGYFGFGENEVA